MLLDNRSHGKVGQILGQSISRESKLSVVSNRFSIYAFQHLIKELKKIQSLRLLLPVELENPETESSVKELTGTKGDRSVRNTLLQSWVANECAKWITSKVDVRSSLIPTPQNMYHVANKETAISITGSSPFTSYGFGFTPSPYNEMNTLLQTAEDTEAMLQWFDSLWNDPDHSKDAKTDLLKQLENIYNDKSPELIYFYTLYNVFRDILGEIDEEKIIKTRTGIKDTLVWQKLYKFQKDGVLGSIDKIEKYNGCIIADSVGLGKTFEALAIIKYYELRNDRVLVLAPKKLRENWTLYTVNDKRNLFADDRFNYDVLNHTDLTRTQGKSGELNLASINWGNYDLVVIDESHNFRNNPPKKEGMTRYRRLMHDIIRSGVKTKVLMLSATPVNSRMNDLKNQVAFITEGVDDALYNTGIVSIETTLKKAQTRFNRWLDKPEERRTTETLLEDLNFDYFKLLDILTIARSRKHIQKYYNIAEIGEFPERAKPKNIKEDIDLNNEFPPLREINRTIRRLNLSSYAPLKYVMPDKLEEYSRKYDMQVSGGSIFRQIDREESLIHLMRVNLLKRMESSINSFALTVAKLLKDVRNIIERIESHDEMDIDELNIEDIEIEAEEFDPFLVGKKVKVLIKDVDRIRWKQELEEDEATLVKLLREAREVDTERDAKLVRLKNLITDKINHPINAGNKKIIVFTAFADTACYLYDNIAEWVQKELGIYSALVTGRTGDNRTTMPNVRRDLSSIITSFSPLSKERSKIDETATDEIDLLIATDCISEGQNLQDCDYLINYDIHWNPVRIIQRFGRIDRLGSKNEVIQLVNFWPNMELDEYINLEARVSGRMVLLDISATGEENIIEFSDAGKMNDLEYRRKQLEQLQDQVMDLEDLSNGISITDLTLGDFRMDLANYLKEKPDALEKYPFGIFSVTKPDDLFEEDIEPGIIFCLRCEKQLHNIDATYALAPFFLVHVNNNGEVRSNFIQAKRILDVMKKLSMGHSAPQASAFSQLKMATKDLSDMSQYQDLLAVAVQGITGKAEEKGVESLFQRGGTTLSKDSFRGIDDFEVVSYLIIMEDDQ